MSPWPDLILQYVSHAPVTDLAYPSFAFPASSPQVDVNFLEAEPLQSLPRLVYALLRRCAV